MKCVLDIETDLAWQTIWMVGLYFPEQDRATYVTTVEELRRELKDVTEIIGHNVIGFDLPRLVELWDFTWGGAVTDTLVVSRLINPNIPKGHGLAACAARAGSELKDDFDAADFDLGLTDKMIDYCLQDCRATWSVYEDLMQKFKAMEFSPYSYELEAEVRRLTDIQESNGFLFDFPKACEIHQHHESRMLDIEAELQEVFPPIVTPRFSAKTGKQLKDSVEVFNPGSRQQVAARLETLGATWSKRTETGLPKVDETTLKALSHIPEAALVLEYLTLSKRIGMVKSWLNAVADDGRIHGRVNTCGAVTGRMTHSSPNLAQIPSDPLYRECFTVAEGNHLVGVDASGLELRMLAHYMQDREYTELILNGDIHSHNQTAAGLDTRDQAKTFIYAFLYGAGDEKIGSIVGGGAAAGAKLKKKFLEGIPALATLLTKVRNQSKSGRILGLDGRKVEIRSEHAALNTLLQSAGAIVMKQALVIACDKLDSYNYPYKLVAQVHDELQIEVPAAYSKRVGVCVRNSIRESGSYFNLRCPLDGQALIGSNWADCH